MPKPINETSAEFVGPTRQAIVALRGGDEAGLREGDIVQVNNTQFAVTADFFKEWSGE